MNAPTVNVPERNRRVKRLLQAKFPGVNISVTAGNGTAYRWIYITFPRRPDPMPKLPEGVRFDDYIADLIVKAGIEISTFNRSDDDRDMGQLPCINITMPRRALRVDQERQDVADYIAEALRESPAFQNKEGWSSSAKVEESVTTSGCPLITFTLDDGQKFNVTITRARA